MKPVSSFGRTLVGVVSVAMALAMVGCSSSSGGPSAGKQNPTEDISFNAGPKADGTPIKIGAIANITGKLTDAREGSLDVAKAWGQWVNETQGGINGHPVELTTADDQTDPAIASSAARDMVGSGAVAVFASADVSAGTLGQYLSANKVPFFSNNEGERPDNAPASWIDDSLGSPAMAYSVSDVAKIAGFHSTAGAVCSENPACASLGDEQKAYGPKIGVDYKGTVTLSATATSATAQCLQLIKSGAESVSSYLGANAALKLLQDCKQQGYKGGFIQVSWSENALKNLPGEQFGMSFAFPWWADAKPVRLYNSVVQHYQPQAKYDSFGASQMWASLELFRAGMTKAGPAAHEAVTTANVNQAMQNGVKDETLGGLLPQPITITDKGQAPVTCFWAVKRDANGKYSTLSGAKSGNGATDGLQSTCNAG